ncbi:TetR/AcrR family transcriptional regulator [Paenibacillus sp. J22TS3]|uniref:TetR/AcrR family transcriptional regulator n=1 Tax=Paenibacillus sp. J22TS3 TaxID=2807192 RepID=UPI001B116C4C|nr:TetR/AcrR family transcriptional regulator [Paenibacillus sp. J22TS3]GIP21649.1 hypothetical protein J22TS3_19240 [Paenibacillus sp. J22TS3]
MPLHEESRGSLEINELILKNARQLIEQRGVDKVSMHQIAKASGIGQGTLYRRYASIGDICLNLIEEKLCVIKEDIRRGIEEPSWSTEERIGQVILKWVRFVEDAMVWIGALDESCHKLQRMGFEFSESHPYVFIFGTLSQLLNQAAAANEIGPCDTCFVVNAFLFLLEPDCYIYLRKSRGYTPDEIADKAYDLYFRPLFKNVKLS